MPHESRAFSSKLLVAQVLGRGLRVPRGLDSQPLVTINNHEAWTQKIADTIKEVLEVENTLSWGYDPRRSEFVFPLHNLRYEPEQKSVETKREPAREPDVNFLPQEKRTTEHAKFSETGDLAVEIEHRDFFEIEDAVKMMRLFIREKDAKIAAAWTKKRLRDFIVAMGPKPGLFDRKDKLGTAVRLLGRALGRRRERRVFWTERVLPDQ